MLLSTLLQRILLWDKEQVDITVFHASWTKLLPSFELQKILSDIKASSLVKMKTLILGEVDRKEVINHLLERKGSFSGCF